MSEEFSLKGKEYIELNKLLKYLGWTDTGGESKEVILGGEVLVNKEPEFRIRRKLRKGDQINYNHQTAIVTE